MFESIFDIIKKTILLIALFVVLCSYTRYLYKVTNDIWHKEHDKIFYITGIMAIIFTIISTLFVMIHICSQ